MKPKAITNRVIVSVIENEKQSPGGIILPFDEPNSKFGKVFSVGQDVVEVSEGDVVCFNSHVGIPQEINGESYLFMKEKDVLGIVTE